MRFFLDGVRTVATETADTARRIQAMREEQRRMLDQRRIASGPALIDQLLQTPMMNVKQVSERCHKSFPAASELVARFEKLGLLVEITGGSRNRIYAYRPYLALLGEDPALKAKQVGSEK